jgi:hypothetical protein
MRQSLKELRKKRTLLDRAIRALEKLETLKARRAQLQRDLKASPAAKEMLPGGFIVLRGGASASRVSRSRSTKFESSPRTASRRGAGNG